MAWERALSEDELRGRGRALFKKRGRQISMYALGRDIYALDNRCPHQGYPLLDGPIDSDRQLTCTWHNWKFDLKSGKCLTGGDPIRTYKTRIKDGFVWVDISEPTKEELTADLLAGFKESFDQHKLGRMTRELAKFDLNKIDPLIAVKKMIEWSIPKLKLMGHSVAVIADWLWLYERNNGNFENQLICLMEMGDYLSAETLGETLQVSAIEEDLEQTLTKRSLEHYIDHGHALINVYSLFRLVDRLGEESCKGMVPLLTQAFRRGKREDLLPEFKKYSHYLKKMPKTFGLTTKKIEKGELSGMSPDRAMGWVVSKSKSYSVESLYKALLEGVVHNLLHFDLDIQNAFDKPVSQNVDYKDVAHGLIFAHAVRAQCQKFPELWGPGLLQLACFVGRHQRFKRSNSELPQENVESLKEACVEHVFDHGLGSHLQAAHRVQATVSALDEESILDTQGKEALWMALHRFLTSPVKEKHLRRKARQNIQLITQDCQK